MTSGHLASVEFGALIMFRSSKKGCRPALSVVARPGWLAVLTAHWLGHDQSVIDLLAIIFIASRMLHATFYITNNGTLRSVSYLIGLACTIALFFAG